MAESNPGRNEDRATEATRAGDPCSSREIGTAEAHEVDVPALQQEILRRLRAGARFRTSHKEGGTDIVFRGGAWTRTDFGESNVTQMFRDERAFLAFLREHFRWEVSRESAPAKLGRDSAPAEVSELEAWRRMLRLLVPAESGASGAALEARGASQRRRTSPGMVVWSMTIAAALALLFARTRAELNDRELSPSIAMLTVPAAVVLVLCVLVAVIWLHKHWK